MAIMSITCSCRVKSRNSPWSEQEDHFHNRSSTCPPEKHESRERYSFHRKKRSPCPRSSRSHATSAKPHDFPNELPEAARPEHSTARPPPPPAKESPPNPNLENSL